MKIFTKILTYFIFPVVIIILIYALYESVMRPVRFNKAVDQRTAVAVDRLKDIRTLQVAYKSQTGRFLSTLDSLVDYYHNGQLVVVKQIGSEDDSVAVAQKLVRRDSILIFVRDTLLKDRAALVDSIKYIPFSGGVKTNMETVVKLVSGINVPLFEAYMPYDDLLKGLNRHLIVNLRAEKEDLNRYPGLKVGSVTSPNNNAGNWE